MSALLPVYRRCDLAFERGEGVYLYTPEGERYLDFAAGIAVNAFGYSHPHLVSALADQAKKLWHVSNLYNIQGLEELASRLTEATFADYAFFCNSGAEAIECGVKMIRKYHHDSGNPDKFRVITFEGSFHGRTMTGISAAQKDKVLAGFEPALDGFDLVPFGDLEAVKAAITPQTGGILIEPIQGEGGVRPASKEFMQGLRKLADENELLLFLDEIQCGMGRTGKLFAYELSDIEPDILASAKGLGGGFPMGACLAKADAAKGMTAGTHGSTYGNNPLAMSVGNAILDLMLADGFLKSVEKIAKYLKDELEKLASEFPDIILEVRGKGLMLGIKITSDSREFVGKLRKKKLLSVAAAENVVRFLPPLIIEKTYVDEGIMAIKSLCKEL